MRHSGVLMSSTDASSVAELLDEDLLLGACSRWWPGIRLVGDDARERGSRTGRSRLKSTRDR